MTAQAKESPRFMLDGMLSLLWIDSGASSRSMSMMYCAGLFLVFLKRGAIKVSTAGVGCVVLCR